MRRCCLFLTTLTSLAVCADIQYAGHTKESDPSSAHPVHVYEGDDALITCVVRGTEDVTVVWKHEEVDTRRWKVLTADGSRVTIDERFEVLHDDGGVVWVLAIHKVKPSDSGLYACEVNSQPVVRTYHKLAVLSRDLQPPESAQTLPPAASTTSLVNYNYTSCCMAMNVSKSCLGFCNVQSILDGNTGQDPEYCEHDFPSIVHCMADGRNHVPCCTREAVPDICQDVCRGEYTTITDNIKTHFSCSAYTEKTLACIVDGIEILPAQPMYVQVDPVSDSSIAVTWTPPFDEADITDYIVNVTMLRSFDPSSENFSEDSENTSLSIITPHSVQVDVKVANGNSVVVHNLSAFTMYEVSVVSKNIHGTSLPSVAVRSLTLVPGQTKTYDVAKAPDLPDVKECCRSKGIRHPVCLETLCNISQSALVEVTDLMICGPWARHTFTCLANGADHTDCCRERGLPSICLDLCSGNITQLNFSYFKCIKYMSTYSSCLMDSYGVLPSRPNNVTVTNRNTDYAILRWEKPSTLGDTVTHYEVYQRLLNSEDYNVTSKASSPFILENLESDSQYEVYVAAVNKYGIGDSSMRIVFRTLSKLIEARMEENVYDYNVTACCVEVGLTSMCLPICSFDASMSRLKNLAPMCSSQFSKLIRCGAGGRNHGQCCARRGVPAACQPLCSGVIVDSVINTASTCVPYIGNIVQCFEEGTGNLPGPVSDLQATEVTDSQVTITWEPPSDNSNITDYVIHYMKVDNTSMHEVRLDLDNKIPTNLTYGTITGLEKGALYNIFVLARNDRGTSLPSSILLINTTKTDMEDPIVGVTSPPHSLSVASHSATYVTITWQPPEISHHAEQLSYVLFYKSGSGSVFTKVETTVTSHMIEGLRPNTQYIIFAKAVSKKGQSLPSETLIAWTDPAYPAFVETPTVHPINLIVEGSSMTILCIAMGTPMPTISLYITGRLVRQEITRHMVTVIYNVTRDMDRISCYADNGYGTPMEARKKIVISHMPHLMASGITMAAYGDSVVLQCIVDAHPEPKMMFWRDPHSRVPVIQGKKYDVSITPSRDEENKWVMQLTIKTIKNGDEGDYYCHAENAFGNDTQPVSVRIRNVAAVTNVTQCCIEQNVSTPCRDACTFYLDIDAVSDKTECINDFDKLMYCAADGSDHRSCCANSGVERSCLDWCRGEPLFMQNNNKICLLSHTLKIFACFREGRDKLPGPPQNVHVEPIDPHAAIVRWNPPIKNPHTVEMYRVFWREVGGTPLKNDTIATSLTIYGLKEGVMYECQVKAGNTQGTSRLTEIVKFTTSDKVIMQTASHSDEHSQMGAAIILVLALAAVAAMVVGAVWFMRTKSLLGRKSSGGVAFANPSYFREVNMDNIQIPQTGDGATMNGSSQGTQAQAGWKHEQLHVPSQSEVPPSLYEELKLGHDGVGFKRLKP